MTQIEPAVAANTVAVEVVERDAAADAMKAEAVIRGLRAAGLKPPFNFDPEEAKQLWGPILSPFPLGILMEAVQDWIEDETDYPTVAELETLARLTLTERQRAERAADRNLSGPCAECGGDRWVRVYDDTGRIVTDQLPDFDSLRSAMAYYRDHPDEATVVSDRGTHVRPCSTCPEMSTRYALDASGHFSEEHIAMGACQQCQPYQAHCAPRKRGR